MRDQAYERILTKKCLTDNGKVIIGDALIADADLAERYLMIAKGTNGKVMCVKWLKRQLIKIFQASQGQFGEV